MGSTIRRISLILTKLKQIYALKVCISSEIRYIYRVWRCVAWRISPLLLSHSLTLSVSWQVFWFQWALLHMWQTLLRYITPDTDYKLLHAPVTMPFWIFFWKTKIYILLLHNVGLLMLRPYYLPFFFFVRSHFFGMRDFFSLWKDRQHRASVHPLSEQRIQRKRRHTARSVSNAIFIIWFDFCAHDSWWLCPSLRIIRRCDVSLTYLFRRCGVIMYLFAYAFMQKGLVGYKSADNNVT